MRFPFGTRGLLAAAAITGGVIYWRATANRRAERLEASVDDAIAEGRHIAETIDDHPEHPPGEPGASFGQD